MSWEMTRAFMAVDDTGMMNISKDIERLLGEGWEPVGFTNLYTESNDAYSEHVWFKRKRRWWRRRKA